ncbi:MAG: hypothetical protein ACXACW_02350, partial [Candidatus Hodarchaeales archaeon]
KQYMIIGTFILIFLSITVVNAIPNATIVTDSTNDVDKVTWSGLIYDHDNGDYRDDIDIMSAAVEENGNNIALSITFQGTPVFDGTHLYWVWISFETGGEEGSDTGAWFYAGGYESDSPEAFWWIMGDALDIETLGTGSDLPVIAGNTLSWVTNSSYWDDLANSGSWEVSIWAWTSDGTSFAESMTLGVSYWDYYPNEESDWNSELSETTTTDGGAPGFDMFVSITTLIAIPIVIKQRRK